MGGGEKERGRKGGKEREREQDRDFAQPTSAGLLPHWDLIFFLAPLKTFPKCCFPQMVMMCPSAEGPILVSAKGKHRL